MPPVERPGHCSQSRVHRSPWAAALAHLPARRNRGAPVRGPSCPGAPAADSTAAESGLGLQRPKHSGSHGSLAAARLQRPEAARSPLANFSRPPPDQTASLGDATVCAVPLKAAGSVLLSFFHWLPKYANPWTGICSQIEPEKGRGRRVTGSAPCMALPGLARRPATLLPCSRRPLPHPAGLTRPPTPRGRLLAPLGREPGAAGTACPDSGRRGEPLCKECSGSPRRAGGGEFPEVAPPRGSVRGAWREQARGKEGCCLRAAGKPSLRRNPRGLGGGVAGLLTPWLSTTPREGEERRARLSSTPAATCRSGVPPTRPWPAWLSHEARPGDPLSLSTRPPPPPCMFPHHQLPSGGRGDSPSLRGHRGGNPPTPSRCDSGSPSHAPFLSFPTAASRSRARWEPGLG